MPNTQIYFDYEIEDGVTKDKKNLLNICKDICRGISITDVSFKNEPSNFFKKFLNNNYYFILVTNTNNNNFKGIIIYSFNKPSIIINLICTTEGSKLGRFLITQFVRKVQYLSEYTHVTLQSVADALGFYQQLGFNCNEKKDEEHLCTINFNLINTLITNEGQADIQDVPDDPDDDGLKDANRKKKIKKNKRKKTRKRSTIRRSKKTAKRHKKTKKKGKKRK